MDGLLYQLILIRSNLVSETVLENQISGDLVLENEDYVNALVSLSQHGLISDRFHLEGVPKGAEMTTKNLAPEINSTISVEIYPNELSNVEPGSFYFENIDDLLIHHKYKEPNYYYVHQLGYLSTTSTSIPDPINSYRRLIKLIDILEVCSDYCDISSGKTKKLVFITDKKVEIEIRYSSEDLSVVEIDERFFDLFNEDLYKYQKLITLKTTVSEMLSSSELHFLSDYMPEIKNLVKTFEKRFELFINEFTYEEFKNQLKSNLLDFTEKINNTVSNLEAKLLFLPAGYIIAISEFEYTSRFSITNITIIVGLVLFFLLIRIFIVNQKETLALIKDEFEYYLVEISAKTNLDERVEEQLITPIKQKIDNQEKSLSFFKGINYVVLFLSVVSIIFYWGFV